MSKIEHKRLMKAVKKINENKKAKKKRNPKGNFITIETGIRQHKTRLNFEATVFRGRDSQGKQIKDTKTFKTLQEAKQWRKEEESKKVLSQSIEANNLTMTEFLTIFMKERQLRLAPTTIRNDTKSCERVKNSSLGVKKLRKIKPMDIEEYFVHLKNELELTNKTINKERIFVQTVFSSAYKKGFVMDNPATKTTPFPLKNMNRIFCWLMSATVCLKH